MDLGTYIEHNGRPAVRFQRVYPHAIERVWQAVTDPDQLRHWFPSHVTFEPRVDGKISFSSDPYAEDATGTVLTYDPPHAFAFTWGDDELHFSLQALEHEQCSLELINVLDASNTAARNAAGWTVCLEELTKLLQGKPVHGPHSEGTLPFRPIYETYVAHGMPSGAEIPDLPGA